MCIVLIISFFLGKNFKSKNSNTAEINDIENSYVEDFDEIETYELEKQTSEIKEYIEDEDAVETEEDEQLYNNDSDSEEILTDYNKTISGILLMKVDKCTHLENEESWKEFYDINIYNIDSNTGDKELVRQFLHVSNSSSFIEGCYWNGYVYQSVFNEDYTLLSTEQYMDDGSYHCGWLDQQNNFTDVSEMISVDLGDFGNVTYKHTQPVFSRDGKYLFFVSDEEYIVRVPRDDIRPETIEQMAKYYSGWPWYVNYDGTVTGNQVGDDNPLVFGPKNTYVERKFVLDWINENTFLLDSVCSVENNDVPKPLVPDVNGRVNYSPVLSPDKSQLAFLSYDKDATEKTTEIFITTSDGNGTPQKVTLEDELDYREKRGDLSNTYTLIGWFK